LLMLAALFCAAALVAPRGRAHPVVWVAAIAVCAYALRGPAQIRYALVLAVAGGAAVLLARRRIAWLFAVLALTPIVRILLREWSWGNQGIDVYGLTSVASNALLHGGNPYGPTYPSYIEGVTWNYPTHFPYGPSIALLAAPGRALGDIRVVSLAMVVILFACVLIYARRRGATRAEQARLAALIAAVPLTAVLILSAWVEAYAMVTFALWLVLRDRHRALAVLALGVCLATKPTIAVAILPMLVWSRPARREIVAAVVVAAVIVLPFAVATGFHQFYEDVAGVHLHLFPTRTDALTINALLHWMGHGFLPSVVTVVVGVILIAVVLLWRPRDAGDLLLLGALISTVAFLFAKEAFANYYWGVIVLLLLAISARGRAWDDEPFSLPWPFPRRVAPPSARRTPRDAAGLRGRLKDVGGAAPPR
jgi:hypothetical protein